MRETGHYTVRHCTKGTTGMRRHVCVAVTQKKSKICAVLFVTNKCYNSLETKERRRERVALLTHVLTRVSGSIHMHFFVVSKRFPCLMENKPIERKDLSCWLHTIQTSSPCLHLVLFYLSIGGVCGDDRSHLFCESGTAHVPKRSKSPHKVQNWTKLVAIVFMSLVLRNLNLLEGITSLKFNRNVNILNIDTLLNHVKVRSMTFSGI